MTVIIEPGEEIPSSPAVSVEALVEAQIETVEQQIEVVEDQVEVIDTAVEEIAEAVEEIAETIEEQNTWQEARILALEASLTVLTETMEAQRLRLMEAETILASRTSPAAMASEPSILPNSPTEAEAEAQAVPTQVTMLPDGAEENPEARIETRPRRHRLL